MVTIAICDDDMLCMAQIEEMIETLRRKQGIKMVMRRFTNPQEFLESAGITYYDFVFLGIEPGIIDGFDIAGKLLSYHQQIHIFFISRHEEYVFDSFAFHTPKFIRKEKLHQDMVYAVQFMEQWVDERYCIRELKNGRNSIAMNLNDVIYVLSQQNYISICMNNYVSHKVRMTMKAFMEEVQFAQFAVINSGTVVNLKYVGEIRRESLVMHDHQEFLISRGRYAEVVRRFEEYKGCRNI